MRGVAETPRRPGARFLRFELAVPVRFCLFAACRAARDFFFRDLREDFLDLAGASFFSDSASASAASSSAGAASSSASFASAFSSAWRRQASSSRSSPSSRAALAWASASACRTW